MMASIWDWTKAQKASDVLTVPSLRLDDIGLDTIDFMKVDAEGAEFEIFKGANIRSRPPRRSSRTLRSALRFWQRYVRCNCLSEGFADALFTQSSYCSLNGTLTPFDHLRDGNLVAYTKDPHG